MNRKSTQSESENSFSWFICLDAIIIKLAVHMFRLYFMLHLLRALMSCAENKNKTKNNSFNSKKMEIHCMIFCFIHFQTRNKTDPSAKKKVKLKGKQQIRKNTRKFTKCNVVLKQWTTVRGRQADRAWKLIS